jgi:hypothetical protein
MQLTKIIALSGLTLSVMACSTTRQQAEAPQSVTSAPVVADSQEYVMRGFSLSVPSSDGWNVAKQGPLNIVLARQGKDAHERYAIQALVVELPDFKDDDEFKRYIETRMNMMRDKSADKIVEVKSELIAGQSQMCVQAHTREMDVVDAAKADQISQGVLELVNFTCRYPDKKNVGIYLAFSKRSAAANSDENITAQANELFKNMNFRDL